MTKGIIQKVLSSCYADYLNTGNKTFIGLVNMIEQELIEEIKKASNESYMNCGLHAVYEIELIGDDEQ